jgi:hypothetical protein
METEIIQRPEKPRDLGTTVDTPTGSSLHLPPIPPEKRERERERERES